jgi:hypothetical protein
VELHTLATIIAGVVLVPLVGGGLRRLRSAPSDLEPGADGQGEIAERRPRRARRHAHPSGVKLPDRQLRRYMRSLRPLATSHQLTGYAVTNPSTMPTCMRNQNSTWSAWRCSTGKNAS